MARREVPGTPQQHAWPAWPSGRAMWSQHWNLKSVLPKTLASQHPVWRGPLSPALSSQELFCVCGALKRARLVHPGVAEVVFVKKDDAITAYKKYNNRCLDGEWAQPPGLALLPGSHPASASPVPEQAAQALSSWSLPDMGRSRAGASVRPIMSWGALLLPAWPCRGGLCPHRWPRTGSYGFMDCLLWARAWCWKWGAEIEKITAGTVCLHFLGGC